jgi:hypothetical protein
MDNVQNCDSYGNILSSQTCNVMRVMFTSLCDIRDMCGAWPYVRIPENLSKAVYHLITKPETTVRKLSFD